ncbi:MAG: hypothetical protein R3E08_05715 [Thiotrichaceae bacterium]
MVYLSLQWDLRGKAAQIKEVYITAFNRMEAQITKQTLRNSDMATFISDPQMECSEISVNLYRKKVREISADV